MAPIFAGEVGISPQLIDDERLLELRDGFSKIELLVPLSLDHAPADKVKVPLDIESLIQLLEPWQDWAFEEQVDLQEWIRPLNMIDACLSYYIQKYPSLLLVRPVERSSSKCSAGISSQRLGGSATTIAEAASVSSLVLKRICIILNFLSGLLMNSSNKAIFNSVEELVDLLAAADDAVAAAALETLCALATPPALHKQQAPEIQQHATALHNAHLSCHDRLIALARGWGSRGLGLGLFSCTTADDSEFGQGSLPQEAGELHFSFTKTLSLTEGHRVEGQARKDDDETQMTHVQLLREDIIVDSAMSTEQNKITDGVNHTEPNKQKRRRVALILGEESIRSTSALFFRCIERAGGLQAIPDDRKFALLAEVRLARSFYCRATRLAAVECRLRALITVLHSHPSQETMSGYFQAQPELCVELVDLLRPTVSSKAVSAAASTPALGHAALAQDAVSVLADSPVVPYNIRELAVQTLTALVARRDGSTGSLTGVARHSNILGELGVAKGQYLGLLPTLIRFSLASLGALTADEKTSATSDIGYTSSSDEKLSLDVGLAFIEATMQTSPPRKLQIIRALEFIDSVLTLTSAVVSTPFGTSALTEGGLIPALLAAIELDRQSLAEQVAKGASVEESLRIKSLLRFVAAQAVQIIEGAIVTHNNALSAFNNLQGVEVLTKQFSQEILMTTGVDERNKTGESMDCDVDAVVKPSSEESMVLPAKSQLRCSQRVLLFSIVTCLTVVFHQESTSSSLTAPSGAKQLRHDVFSKALITILDDADSYGGHLVSLVATLMSDVMNSDPLVIRHVHGCGLGESFLRYFPAGEDAEPILPPVQELIMTVPNVLSALALTEDGAKVIKEANPFPALLKIFYHSKYAMPRSRCLLNEMTAIIGTGLDEIMRNVRSLKPIICAAIVAAINEVAKIGESLVETEKQTLHTIQEDDQSSTELEDARSCLMQYALNFGQLLEQILHNEDHCESFVSAGGLQAIIRLYPSLIPSGTEFLSHTSCLSCPSVSTLGHSTTEDSLTLAFKCIALRSDPFKVLQCLINTIPAHLRELSELEGDLRRVLNLPASQRILDVAFLLDGVPQVPIYELEERIFASNQRDSLSAYLRKTVVVQWIVALLSSAIKAACQNSYETGTGWSRQEREWKKEVSSTAFEELVAMLSAFGRSASFEVCRVRTADGFEEADRARQNPPKRNLRYRLRIVCPEGAVVRNGIEIDSCASVGSMEMSEIVDAFDRCVNTSGVLRYQTRRGWVSEQTRGHGREPIAEVLRVWKCHSEILSSQTSVRKRVEVGVPDLRTTCANILARIQSCHGELFLALSKLVSQGIRSVPARALSLQPGTIGAHISNVMSILTTEIRKSFCLPAVVAQVKGNVEKAESNPEGAALYLGCLLSFLRSCLFEEKRERRNVCVPLLIATTLSDETNVDGGSSNKVGVFDAIRFVLQRATLDFEIHGTPSVMSTVANPVGRRRISRVTAASFPSAIAILKRFASGSSIVLSPTASILNRIKVSELPSLLGKSEASTSLAEIFAGDENFSTEKFSRFLLCNASETVMHFWMDENLIYTPPHISHPIAMLVGEVIVGLEDAMKKSGREAPRSREESGLWTAFRGLVSNRSQLNEERSMQDDFEPSEEAITRLMEMGFSREHSWNALDSTRSNRLEVAMEYALSHPSPSSEEISRRQAARADRRRQQSQVSQAVQSNDNSESNDGFSVDETAGSDTMQVDGNPNTKDTQSRDGQVDRTLERASSCLGQWKTEAPSRACDILSSLKDPNARSEEAKHCSDGDSEALTVVLSSFLLDLCQVYPTETNRVALELFHRLHSKIAMSDVAGSTQCSIESQNEFSFSILCHASVLLARALPRTRKLLLKFGLVGKIISCIHSRLSDETEENATLLWLAPAVLLLDIMAQPIIAFSEKDENEDADFSEESELKEVQMDHKKQAGRLSSLAEDLFGSLQIGVRVTNSEPEDINTNELTRLDNRNIEKQSSSAKENENHKAKPPFGEVPAYFPLIPSSQNQKCADICLQILGGPFVTPGIVHATLLLLMRLLRSPTLSTYCTKAGAAALIVNLSQESRFTGHTGIVTLVLRRLLEDEAGLEAAMEAEIRGTILKLHGKSPRRTAEGLENLSVSRKAFLRAMTPLLCREPLSFLKAASVTLRFESLSSGSSSDAKVSLLSSSERNKAMRVVADVLKRHGHGVSTRQQPPRRSSFGKGKKSVSSQRSKNPVRSNKRGSTPKRAKKEKSEIKEKGDDEPRAAATVSTLNLLMNNAMKMTSRSGSDSGRNDSDFGFDSSFLWTADVLGIIADLVLAIPACATAIHRFRLIKTRSKEDSLFLQPVHALAGCPAPPKTFVSFILHSLIVQDRDSPRDWKSDCLLESSIEDDSRKSQHRVAVNKGKVAQASARLLIALVARPGEGRRQVIAELIFAMSGGKIGISPNPRGHGLSTGTDVERQITAILAWAELCIGLAAPRGNGTNYDTNGALSYEVIRIMLDLGMAHALLLAMHMTPLHHPKTTTTVSALLLAFEVFSRPAVEEGVKALIERDSMLKEARSTSKSERQSHKDAAKSIRGDTRRDSFADDHLLEEAFSSVPCSRSDTDDRSLEDGGHDFVVQQNGRDVEEMEVDEDGEESEDEMSSEGSEISSDEDEEENDEDDMSEDGEDDDETEDEATSLEEDGTSVDGLDAGSVFYEPAVVDEGQFYDDAAAEGSEHGDQGLDDGWTRIETTGFGGTVLGGRRALGQHGNNSNSSRTRGFIDAAEAMIGSLLRSGEIQNDALAEIEGSLGIRIMHNGRRGAMLGNTRSDSSRDGFASRIRQQQEPLGTLPQISQRSQPDVGYSALGGGGRWSEINAMEYIFGGASITAGNRNYDLVPRPLDHDEVIREISQVDCPLFPGGPASVAHTRTQQSIHPLLCGVDLPPINALISDMLPHGIRAIRQGQITTRRPGEWGNNPFSGGGFLMSTSNGSIIRSSRSSVNGTSSMLSQARRVPVPLGWTDDGLPFDSSVEQFSTAFERALGESLSAAQQSHNTSADLHGIRSGDTGEIHATSERSTSEGRGEEHMSEPADPVSEIGRQQESESELNDGDGVVSSLAAGLRLSSEGEGQSRAELPIEGAGIACASGNDAEGSPEDTADVEPGHLEEQENAENNDSAVGDSSTGGANTNAVECPPGMDPEVFSALPVDMQQEVLEQARMTSEVASRLDPGSSLDPEALAALPEDMRREVMEQEERERRLQSQAPADPANAEEMDNASFVASLSPELRQEILMTADDAFLNSLPADIIAEAQILRERASSNRRSFDAPTGSSEDIDQATTRNNSAINGQPASSGGNREASDTGVTTSKRKIRACGKIRVETDRETAVFLPEQILRKLSAPVANSDFRILVHFLYLLDPVRPTKVLQKVFQNLSSEPLLRKVVITAFIKLLHDDSKGSVAALNLINMHYKGDQDWRKVVDDEVAPTIPDFPPSFLIGPAPAEFRSSGFNPNISIIRKKQFADAAASVATNIPVTARGSRQDRYLPPVVATKIVDIMQSICKASPRFCIQLLTDAVYNEKMVGTRSPTGFEKLVDLLEKPKYSKSSANLEQLLILLELVVSPLSHLSKNGEDDAELSQKELELASSANKEWIDVPRIVLGQERLQLLCSILRMETCRDSSLTKVNTIARRLCRVDANRGYVLAELASVARALGVDAIRDLKALAVRMATAAEYKRIGDMREQDLAVTGGRGASSSVAVSTSTSELKLLRVLQTLQGLCSDITEESSSKRNDGKTYVTEELVSLLRAMELDELWNELTSCLQVVQVLEGVKIEEVTGNQTEGGDNEDEDEAGERGKKLQNSVAGLLTRFLPSIEAFFVANASSTRASEKNKMDRDDLSESGDNGVETLVDGQRLIEFVEANKILLNALIRNNSGLLDRGLRALIQVPRCRHLLDFDVKRHWFKAQVRRLRQHANRRHGSLRLHIRRHHVFEDAYHQLRLRNADEMRGRLHITFRDEQGVDAGGLSREFFGILAKEIFNPNYALFTSTEDGSTFQPNPNSSINPDHLSYFRFVGRIVGKAVSDGYLLDAHFTRSLYKHMLGIKPTHHDMEAIDPDYYKNLKTILEYDLRDLGLELTFSIEDHSFGRTRLIDLIPDGRKTAVTEANKAKYVSLVCQHRMTTAISSQIRAYMDGFYELVSRNLIAVFTPRELELLISGLPDIDVHDLRVNTDYVGWRASDAQIQWFWNVLLSLTRNQKAAFLQFVTGSSKVPLAGFGQLPGMRGVQKFSIHKAGGSEGALMSAHTCFNSLDLPPYESEEELKEKLLYAITEGAGTFMLA